MYNVLESMEKELLFSIKYCARMASIHQHAKEEVTALTEKVRELKEREVLKLEKEKAEIVKQEEAITNINITACEATPTQMV